jgi:hypothetical protein
MTTLTGSCKCGDVRFAVRGSPSRIGICHCTDCRQESGSAFTFFGVWPAANFETKGETSEYDGRQFCPRCGSRLFSADGHEGRNQARHFDRRSDAPDAHVRSVDQAPRNLAPTVEGAEQFLEDRT